ncbi:hypothetical protein [Chryseobacterium mucoviscidosis]|uniref:hypothetical protein n=1 Tax=Chryseobacterium mucoviscidosis TaxID=1945581 RepID=UPI003017F776
MKTILNLIITASIIAIMCDCEVNSHRTELDYTNSIYAGFFLVTAGFFRLYYKYLNKILKQTHLRE